jgi:sugar lactone lactonase YvrE
LRYDAQRQCLVRVAGNGKAGIDGDGGPAVRARLGEITSLAEDSTGQLYISDVHNGVVRRFVPGGRIATLAHVPGAVGIDIDPGGRYLAIASIERGVMRLNLSTGGLETVVPIGEGVDGPHGLRYDARGDLWVADPGSRVIRIDHSSGELNEVARIDTATLLPTCAGGLRHCRKPGRRPGAADSPDGSRRKVVGTGRISRQRNDVRATRVGIRPTAVALARNGSLLVAQDRPVPALRRVSRRGIITTVTR